MDLFILSYHHQSIHIVNINSVMLIIYLELYIVQLFYIHDSLLKSYEEHEVMECSSYIIFIDLLSQCL